MPDFSFELQSLKNNKIVAGCDEAGRGCLAGPVSGAAVVFKDHNNIPDGINDSKKLSTKKREQIYQDLLEADLIWNHHFVDNHLIDEINILEASYLCINKAAEGLAKTPNHLLVDGNRFKSKLSFTTIIKGDSISLSIAAASIIAKVRRDKFMVEVADTKYPQYGFAKHKGYATKQHFEAIRKHGHCELHRLSFLRKFYNTQFKIFD